jgi:hypothetical protein
MVNDPVALIEEFMQAAAQSGSPCGTITHEHQAAPHAPHCLPSGMCAVYVFSLCACQGRTCPAGPNRVLKVGKAGPNSNARFQSQHYDALRAESTLAGSLLKSRLLWTYLGITDINQGNVSEWIKKHTDRDHFFLAATSVKALGDLERFIKAKLGPVFEGG